LHYNPEDRILHDHHCEEFRSTLYSFNVEWKMNPLKATNRLSFIRRVDSLLPQVQFRAVGHLCHRETHAWGSPPPGYICEKRNFFRRPEIYRDEFSFSTEFCPICRIKYNTVHGETISK
jgi:hypothetical protein